MSLARLRFLPLVLALALVATLISVVPAYGSGTAGMDPHFAKAVETLAPESEFGAFVHFSGGSTAEQTTLLQSRGLTVTGNFDSVDVVFAVGTIDKLAALRDVTGVTYLEANRRLSYLGDTGVWASRAAVARESVSGGPFTTALGDVIDGSGIGIAVVDSGVAGTHPDLANRLAKSFKVVCSTPGLISTATEMCFGPYATVEAAETDNTGGHGTHVSGIALGDGTASNGTYTGVAPDAKLFSYGVGELIVVLNAAEAFDHIIENYDTFVPRIRVVNNSWGDPAGSDYNPNSVLSKLTRALVEKGASVVFAAGNGDDNGFGGTGAEPDDFLSSTAKDPTPGVITAANYSDGNTGSREGTLNTSSSRGKRGLPETYPDLSAPGTSIISTCRPTLPVCDLGPTVEWQPYYASLSGTSMASPHIAGAAALLYETNPGLTPAQVEDILLDTARKFTFEGAYEADPQNPGSTTSFDKGAGLLDVPAALMRAGLELGGVPANDGSTRVIADGDGGDQPAYSSADIASVTATELSGGVRYAITVVNAAAPSPFYPSFRLYQNVDGKAFTTMVAVTATGAAASAPGTSNTAIAQDVTREGNTISFTLPFSAIGNPPAGAPAHNVRVLSYANVVADAAPGGTGPQGVSEPEFGAFTIAREGASGGSGTTDPDPTPTPTATVDPSPTPTVETTPTTAPPTEGTRQVYPAIPNDPLYPPGEEFLPGIAIGGQWGMDKIHATEAWQEERATGFGVNVAVVDSGVDLAHEDLQCPGKLRIVPGADATDEGDGPSDVDGHGTHVAGIIGACTNNGKGVIGVAPDATLLPIQVLGAEGGTINDIAEGVRAAVDGGAHVINMSLGVGVGAMPTGGGFIGLVPELFPEVDSAIEYANSQGVVVVAAAGNDSYPFCEYPALAEDVVCVGATDTRDLNSYYSDFPIKTDTEEPVGAGLMAPGGSGQVFCDANSENILSTYATGLDGCDEGFAGYRGLDGTSMAAPHVAGAAALVYDRLGAERTPENAAAVIQALITSADDLYTEGWDPISGYGRLNAASAVRAVEPAVDPDPSPTPTETVTPSVSPTPSASPTPTAVTTTTEFTTASAVSGQYSDTGVLVAKVSTTDGVPVEGQEVVFRMDSATTRELQSAVTDADGIATASIPLLNDPGSYETSVVFSGDADDYLGSADTGSFVIEKEDSLVTLIVDGKGANRILRSSLSDADSSVRSIAGADLEFFADGVSIGTATTDDSGVVSFAPPERYRGGKYTFEVRFAGDTLYLPSAASATT